MDPITEAYQKASNTLAAANKAIAFFTKQLSELPMYSKEWNTQNDYLQAAQELKNEATADIDSLLETISSVKQL